jgi:hypothetical protein
MTFLELQNAVLANVIDTPTAVRNAVPRLVKRAHKKLQTKHNFFIQKAKLTQDTVVNTRDLIAIPSDWKRARSRPYFTDTGLAQYLTWAQEKDILGQFVSTDTGRPVYLLEDASSIEIYPLPDGRSQATGGEYTVVVPYFKYLPDLVAEDDTDWFTENAEAYIEYSASAMGFAMDWDETHSTYWDTRAQMEFKDVINADKERWLGALDTFTPNLGAYGPRTQR